MLSHAVSTVPVLQTHRLVLRGHRLDDLDAVSTMWSTPAVTAHITGKPSTRQESWARVLRYAGLWPLFGYGYWAVEERASGLFMGDVGFGNFKRDLVPSLDDIPEIGWVLDPKFHGQGYATEAVQAALSWMDREFGAPLTACIIAPDNVASLRVAEKCGYQETALTSYNDHAVIMMQRSRSRKTVPGTSGHGATSESAEDH